MKTTDLFNNNKNKEYIKFLRSRIRPNISPEIANLMIKYAMTPKKHKEILAKIENYCFSDKKSSEKPKLYIMISQTGSGKSLLAKEILNSNNNIMVIESEFFKLFHPKQKEIIKKYPTFYGYLTGLDSLLYKEEIYQKSLENKYNILMSIAPLDAKNDFDFLFDKPLKLGYEIEINIIAVSNINSLLSIHERYERQLKEHYHSPKLTDLGRATSSFGATKSSLKYLIQLPFTKINIWKRSPFNLDYFNAPIMITNEKSKALEFYENAIIQDEIETISNAKQRIEKIYQSMQNRSAPKEQFEQFEKVEQIIQETIQNRNRKTIF